MNIQKLRVVPALLEAKEKAIFATNAGFQSSNILSYTCMSSSDSDITFNSLENSEQRVVSRNIFLRVQFLVRYTGDAGIGNVLYRPGTDAPRELALWNVFQTVTMNLNGTAISIPMGETIQPLSRYQHRDHFDSMFSGTCPMPDQYQQYDDWVQYGGGNALADYSNGAGISIEPRGGHSGITVLTNTQFLSEVVVELYAPIPISPLAWASGKYDERGFSSLQQLGFVFNFYPGFVNRLMSRDSSNSTVLTSAIATIADPRLTKPSIDIKSSLPQQIDMLPPNLVYDYSNVFTVTSGSILAPANSSFDFFSQNVRLQAIPDKMYFWLSPSQNSKSIYLPDTYARIDSLNIQLDGSNSMLSQINRHSLYHMFRKNGLQQTYTQSQKFQGSIGCVEFASDLSMQPGRLTSSIGSFNFQLTGTARNLSLSRPQDYVLTMCFITNGLFEIIRGESSRTHLAIIGEEDSRNLMSMKSIIQAPRELYGSSFLSSANENARKVVQFGKKAYTKAKEIYNNPLAQQALSLAKKVAPLALPLIGLGDEDEEEYARPSKQLAIAPKLTKTFLIKAIEQELQERRPGLIKHSKGDLETYYKEIVRQKLTQEKKKAPPKKGKGLVASGLVGSASMSTDKQQAQLLKNLLMK